MREWTSEHVHMRGFKYQFIVMYDCSHNTIMVLELQPRAHYHLLNTVRMALDGEAVHHKLTALHVKRIGCYQDCHIPESSCSKTHLKLH